MTPEDINELEQAWLKTCASDWEQDRIRPNILVDKGAMTDANSIATFHGEFWEEHIQFVVMARNLLPEMIAEMRKKKVTT
jgi:hypothetical protein